MYASVQAHFHHARHIPNEPFPTSTVFPFERSSYIDVNNTAMTTQWSSLYLSKVESPRQVPSLTTHLLCFTLVLLHGPLVDLLYELVSATRSFVWITRTPVAYKIAPPKVLFPASTVIIVSATLYRKNVAQGSMLLAAVARFVE